MTNDRIARLQEKLNPGEAMLVESEANRLYLTRFPSSAGQVLITPDAAYFLIDSRYAEKAAAVVTGAGVVLSNYNPKDIAQRLHRHGCSCLFTETGRMSIRRFEMLQQALPDIRLSREGRLEDLLTAMRQIKSPEELSCIRRAQKLTDDTFTYILDRIRPGRTEREILLDMEFYMRRQGSEGVSFDFIVVSGRNSSLPHGVATDKPVEAGDFVTMDFGAVVEGYRSDMTRTVAVGHVDEEQRRVYATVLEAQRGALAAVRAGLSCREVDRTARDIIAAAGYGDFFGHGLGHSVGLEIHEEPRFSPACDAVLSPGMVMTVEPGVYLPGRFGVRIEDMVAVTDDGCENFTASDKTLLVLP